MNKDELNKIVNKSGFPFQIAVNNVIQKNKDKHGWEVIAHELPWKNLENGTHGYVDLVVNQGVAKLVVECKRVLNSPNWIFLTTSEKDDFQAFYGLRVNENNKSIRHATWDKYFAEPLSQKSEFCTIDGNDRAMIENNISLLVDAIETLALVDIKEVRDKLAVAASAYPSLYIPVIVTTANLFISKFKADEINLKDGKVPVDNNTFISTDIVRYEKTIKTTKVTASNIYSSEGVVTCFIVTVEGLLNLLQQFNLKRDNWIKIA